MLSARHSHGLRLVVGRDDDGPALSHTPIRVTNRPSDRSEPLLVDQDADLREFRRRARALGLAMECALALAVERWQIESAIERVAADPVSAIKHLDEAAQAVAISEALPGAESDYVRHLLGLTPPRAEPDAQEIFGLPMRLTAHISGQQLVEAASSTDLESAARWEVAALVSGQTMSEWSAWRLAAAAASR